MNKKNYKIPEDPFEVDYLKATVKYKTRKFLISQSNWYSGIDEWDFEIEVFNERFGEWSIYLDTDIKITSMWEAIEKIRNFIHNELK